MLQNWLPVSKTHLCKNVKKKKKKPKEKPGQTAHKPPRTIQTSIGLSEEEFSTGYLN